MPNPTLQDMIAFVASCGYGKLRNQDEVQAKYCALTGYEWEEEAPSKRQPARRRVSAAGKDEEESGDAVDGTGE